MSIGQEGRIRISQGVHYAARTQLLGFVNVDSTACPVAKVVNTMGATDLMARLAQQADRYGDKIAFSFSPDGGPDHLPRA